MRQAIGKIVTVPETLAFPIQPQSIRVSNYRKPVQMVIYGNSYDELESIQNEIINELRKNKREEHPSFRTCARNKKTIFKKLYAYPIFFFSAIF